MQYTVTIETTNAALRPSWDSDCECGLAARWRTARALYKVATDISRDEIETAWHDRLDRLYLNTAMPESTYEKYLRLADRAFTERES